MTVADVRLTGVVAAFKNGRGFGFVRTPGRPDLFFHYSDCEPSGDLAVGTTVAYEVDDEGRDGRPRAVRVRPC